MAPFYGAPPMALLTVGAGALLVGRDVIGATSALDVAALLWTLGTLSGLVVSVLVPVLMFTRHDLRPETTFATWLLPIVPPMVSAATGAALIGHLPAGQPQLTMLLACWAMFGLSLIASLVTITIVWSRLAYHKTGRARMIPTTWIVLGPLGQGITAANLLGSAAKGVIPAPYAGAMNAFGVIFGVPVWGFAMLWLAIAVALTVHVARDHLPFSLTWWSFVFPVGTCVTATSELARHTGAQAFTGAAVALFALLVGAWVTVGVRTLHSMGPHLRRLALAR
jgi:tellurite resistance protein TehA-like permease